MHPIVLCADGIEATLEPGLCLVFLLRETNGEEVARFEVDPSELRAILRGEMAFQASDGRGHSIGMQSGPDGLRIRLEAKGHPAKNCRIAQDEIQATFRSRNMGVLL